MDIDNFSLRKAAAGPATVAFQWKSEATDLNGYDYALTRHGHRNAELRFGDEDSQSELGATKSDLHFSAINLSATFGCGDPLQHPYAGPTADADSELAAQPSREPRQRRLTIAHGVSPKAVGRTRGTDGWPLLSPPFVLPLAHPRPNPSAARPAPRRSRSLALPAGQSAN